MTTIPKLKNTVSTLGMNAGITTDAKDTCPMSLAISDTPFRCSADKSVGTYSFQSMLYYTKRIPRPQVTQAILMPSNPTVAQLL